MHHVEPDTMTVMTAAWRAPLEDLARTVKRDFLTVKKYNAPTNPRNVSSPVYMVLKPWFGASLQPPQHTIAGTLSKALFKMLPAHSFIPHLFIEGLGLALGIQQ